MPVNLQSTNCTVCLPWSSSSKREGYTVNTYPHRPLRGQSVLISIRQGFVSD